MNYVDFSNEELAAKLQGGEFAAFTELSLRFRALIEAKVRLHEEYNSPEYEDYIQEGYLALYLAALSYNQALNTSFATYASVCVANGLVSVKRSKTSKKHAVLSSSLPLETASGVEISEDEQPENILEMKFSYEHIIAEVESKLSKKERQALSLYLSGYTRDEVESKTCFTKKSYDNALRRLRKKLDDLR